MMTLDPSRTATSVRHPHGPTGRTRTPWPALVAMTACLIGVTAAGWDLGNEARTGAGGDTPRYLMNGVYFYDLLRDRPFASPTTFLDYTRLYYARYPALSLGHHPVLLSLMEVPVFAVAGPSVAAGRAVVAFWFGVLIWLTYAIGRDTFDGWTGAAAALLLSVNFQLIDLGRSVMADVPALALLLLVAWLLHRFCERQRRGDLVACAAAVVLAAYAKHLTVFAMPGLIAYAAWRLGLRRLLAKDTLVAAAVVVLLVSPLVPVTLDLSRSNVRFVSVPLAGDHDGVPVAALAAGRLRAARVALRQQFVLATLGLAVAGLVLGTWHWRQAALFFACWVASVAVCVLVITGTIEPIRYSVYWVPALAVLAASPLSYARAGWPRRVTVACLATAVGGQALATIRAPVTITTGYEDVARVVISQPPAPTVLFSGEIDSGLFVFFMRKHDPGRRQIVLRADKVLTTSFMMNASIEELVSSPEGVYDVLNRLGVGYVVVEDRRTSARVLDWVRQMVRSDHFSELYKVPVISTDPRMRHASLAVYRYRDARKPEPGVELAMKIPLAGRSLALPLSDLLDRKYLR